MKNKKLGLNSAFPEKKLDINTSWRVPVYKTEGGISRRLYIATAAMQGLLVSDWDTSEELLVKSAYNVADEMLKQELEETNE